jgi:hypothetical protein
MRNLRPRALAAALAALLCACGDESKPSRSTPAAPAAPVAATGPAPATSAAPASAKPTAAPAEKPRLISDQWYRTTENGQPSGWFHVRWTRSQYAGKPTVHDRTESFSSSTRMMGRIADSFESRDYSDLERTEDGLLLHLETRNLQGDRETATTADWTGKGYESTSRVNGMEEKRSVACESPCPVDPEAFLTRKIQRGEVAVGGHFEYAAPNYVGARMDTVALDVQARETLTLSAGKFDCFRVTERVAGAPFQSTWWFDQTGVLRRQASERSQIESATESEARDVREGGATNRPTTRRFR